jgi:hypothetical protein
MNHETMLSPRGTGRLSAVHRHLDLFEKLYPHIRLECRIEVDEQTIPPHPKTASIVSYRKPSPTPTTRQTILSLLRLPG